MDPAKEVRYGTTQTMVFETVLGSELKDYRSRQPTTEFSFKYKLNNEKKRIIT